MHLRGEFERIVTISVDGFWLGNAVTCSNNISNTCFCVYIKLPLLVSAVILRFCYKLVLSDEWLYFNSPSHPLLGREWIPGCRFSYAHCTPQSEIWWCTAGLVYHWPIQPICRRHVGSIWTFLSEWPLSFVLLHFSSLLCVCVSVCVCMCVHVCFLCIGWWVFWASLCPTNGTCPRKTFYSS